MAQKYHRMTPPSLAALFTLTLSLAFRPNALASAERVSSFDRLPPDVFPPVDRSVVDPEDAENDNKSSPRRFAIPNYVHIDAKNGGGTWEFPPEGGSIWRYRAHSPVADSINFGFESYRMPEGGELRLLSAGDGSPLLERAFTSKDNSDSHGELWTPILDDDDVVVEAKLPVGVDPSEMSLVLTAVNVGYRGFRGRRNGRERARARRGVRALGGGHNENEERRLSGACNVDVECQAGDDWRDEIPSVAVISTSGYLSCSGAMVNNVEQDQKPLFLTANHCGVRKGNAGSLVAYWNYESSKCGNLPPDGSLTQFTTGSTLLASLSKSDFTLVELDSKPDSSWGVTYAGWDANAVNAAWAVAIHHPNADEKSISFEYDPTTTEAAGAEVRVRDWDLGTTEPGSSGSPLFNQNHHIIGQLWRGSAACDNDLSDWYGKLSHSWNGGGRASNSLKPWLDPGNTGTLTIDTLVPPTSAPPPEPTPVPPPEPTPVPPPEPTPVPPPEPTPVPPPEPTSPVSCTNATGKDECRGLPYCSWRGSNVSGECVQKKN